MNDIREKTFQGKRRKKTCSRLSARREWDHLKGEFRGGTLNDPRNIQRVAKVNSRAGKGISSGHVEPKKQEGS